MKKFIYPMQSILGIKVKLENQEKTNYQIAIQKLNEEEAKLLELELRKEQYEQKIRDYMSSPINVIGIKQCLDAIETLKEIIQNQKKTINKAKQIVEINLARLNRAVMERKTHEKLKENAFDTYKIEMEAEERKEVDELVSFQFGCGVKEST